MSAYQRPKGSVDVKLEEVPEGNYRVRILGTIVNVTATTTVINDGQNQIAVNLGKIPMNSLRVGEYGRAILDLTKSGTEFYGTLLAWNKMTPDQAKKYWTLVKIERRIPK